ncbi:hypothetical protein [Kibdelosporangium phytohabitans]|uniref:Uncharacterized protein n=1 Tax=Kibdelosporangium phytohabitans TaxID=860235 RepID=A0A0N9HUD5_9PSEU|nr:hypothetical protein [Kibdelosporangium phytohabitans]ALG06548.1 hypothetical protein AOZ06_06060 [Kibdelosporangium phytohabitans]MBE1467734.1 hypothetical protein [Kibdelosporangium phytohabitans]
MNLTAGLPAWTLRGVVLCAAALILILLAAQGVGAFPLGIVALLGVLSVTAPGTPAPAFLIVATAVAVAVVSDDAFDIRVLALVPLVHLVHIGCALAAVIPGTARVHLSALRPAAARFALVQLVVAGLAGVAALVPETVTPAAMEVAALLGTAALAVIATRLIMKRPQ